MYWSVGGMFNVRIGFIVNVFIGVVSLVGRIYGSNNINNMFKIIWNFLIG